MPHENKQRYIEVEQSNLPLSCPMPDMVSWNSHPKVYLDIADSVDGKITCPYCSTVYSLKNFK